MNRRVVFYDDAKRDLGKLADWIAERAGVGAARGYANRIRRYCERFDVFSERGTRRDELRPGIRTIGFEKARHYRVHRHAR